MWRSLRLIAFAASASLFLSANAETVSLSPWGTVAGDANKQIREALITLAPGEATTLPLDVPGAGYIAFEMVSDTPADLELSVETLEGRELVTPLARVGLGEELMVTLSSANGVDAAGLSVQFMPERDFKEPNNIRDLAWPIQATDRFEAVLFPEGDIDVFTFELEQESQFSATSDSTDKFVELSISMGADEPFVDLDGWVTLQPGQYYLATQYADRRYRSNDVSVLIDTIATPVFLGDTRTDIELTSPKEVVFGIPTPVLADAQGKWSVPIRLKRPALVQARLRNLNDDVVIGFESSAGERIEGTSAHLPKGRYTVTADKIEKSDRLALITLFRSDFADTNEPNDGPSSATPLRVDQLEEVVLEAAVPSDWLVIPTRTAGDLYLRVDDGTQVCGSLSADMIATPDAQEPDQDSLEVADGADPSVLQAVTKVVGQGTSTFGPIAVEGRTETLVRLSCQEAVVDAVVQVRPELRDPDAEDVIQPAPIYVIGLELSDAAQLNLSAAARDAGVSFLDANEAATLDERIAAVQAAEETRLNATSKSGVPIIWVLLAGVGAIGLLFIVLGRRSRKRGALED